MFKLLKLIARSLLTAAFVTGGIGKFREREKNLGYMASKGMPRSPTLLNAAAVMEAGLSPSVIMGLKSEYTAALLALYLIPTTVIFHDFWNAKGPEREAQLVHFMKNLAIVGGLLSVALYEREHRQIEAIRDTGKASDEVSVLPAEREFGQAA